MCYNIFMTDIIFSPGKIASLTLSNRLVRSATAERMADGDGRPLPKLLDCYRKLVGGGVGLIITGHMYVHPTGKAHPEMTGVYDDSLLDGLAGVTRAVHQEGGKIAAQINHGGLQASEAENPMAPSVMEQPTLKQPAREMTAGDIQEMAQAYGQAARRVKEAGFDAVEIHAAHGYLISQFLSPLTNHRTDEWGGDLEGRMRFLREVSRCVRQQVGNEYPVLIKLGMMDHTKGGLTSEEGARVAAALEGMGINGLEISGGMGAMRVDNIRPGIRTEAQEAYFLPLAKLARPATRLPILLVGGFRSRTVMERVLESGKADFISLCRPLICEPDFPNRLRHRLQERSSCISANHCWAEKEGDGIACKCPLKKAEKR